MQPTPTPAEPVALRQDDPTPRVLTIEGLCTHFEQEDRTVRAVDGVSLQVPAGRTVCVVGESGSGKSQTAYSVLRLIDPPGRIVDGDITLHDEGRTHQITRMDDDGPAIRHVRGNLISMIFQEPMSSLSPVHRVGPQVAEAVRVHRGLSRAEARQDAVQMMGRVGIPEPETRYKQYPHEMSGGLRQRVTIAMALVCRPRLLIADEPTTALDVTTQAQILELMQDLQVELGMSILLITHDLGVVAEMADEVAVMYMGRIVEHAPVFDLFDRPQHPYTQALLGSMPRLDRPGSELRAIRGSVPAGGARPPGCPFHPRCDEAVPGKCNIGDPPSLIATRPGHINACILRHEEMTRDD